MSNDIANDAYQKFLAKNYEQCSVSLHSLLSSSPRADPKVQHNVAVVDFLKDSCQEGGKFLSDLAKLGKSAEREKRLEHPNSTAAVAKFAASKMMEYRPLCLEFEGHENVKFNEAVVLFHQRQYGVAVDRLMPMYYNPEQIPKLMHTRVTLLLLSCALAQYTHGDNALRLRISQLLKKLNEADDYIKQHDASSATLKLAPHAMLLKSHYTAIFGSQVEAHKHLTHYLNTDAGHWWNQTTYLNNLGVLSLSNKRPQMASLYFTKAIENFEKNRPKTDGQSPTGLSNYPAMATIYYNSAVCHMLRGQYELAFKAFVVATPMLRDTPTLWLRLAQCCIKQWEAKVAVDLEKAYEEKCATIAKNGLLGRVAEFMPTKEVTWGAGGEGGEMSLVFADKCIRNAHYLLLCRTKGKRAGAAEEQTDRDDAATSDDTAPAPEEEPEIQLEAALHEASADDASLSSLLQSVYCNMAYIALCLGNYSVALTSATKLLSLPSIYKEYKLTCLSYCTEAYCRLGRAPEALDLLHSINLQDLLENPKSCLNLPCGGIQQSEKLMRTTIDVPAFEECPVHIGATDQEKEKMSVTHSTALFTNLCVVHIMMGKFSRAQQCLDQFRNDDQPVADLLQVYLRLAMGDKRGAVMDLKEIPMSPPFVMTA
eukprot:TRINITY_DN769_c1_g1_i1.p1 TRINITY_DN769_c1_g1~~TRINITY_DN769_c1_g1_i1.p1  ORF type:complete len:651 (+),score=151.71 TRINITY_DN769_c1_g1_i1:185-2137(+)